MASSEFSASRPVYEKADAGEKKKRQQVRRQLNGELPPDIEAFAFTSVLLIFTGDNLLKMKDDTPKKIHKKEVE